MPADIMSYGAPKTVQTEAVWALLSTVGPDIDDMQVSPVHSEYDSFRGKVSFSIINNIAGFIGPAPRLYEATVMDFPMVASSQVIEIPRSFGHIAAKPHWITYHNAFIYGLDNFRWHARPHQNWPGNDLYLRPTISFGVFFPPSATNVFLPRSETPAKIKDNEIGLLFQRLRSEWYEETEFSSSTSELVMCDAYQRIIGIGSPVLPFIFDQLRNEGDDPDQWFWALEAITREDPVPQELSADRRAVARIWLDWASLHGYAPQ